MGEIGRCYSTQECTGGAGGGSINIFYEDAESYIDGSKCAVNGGRGGAYTGNGYKCYAGAGGNGSITIGSIESGTFVSD